MRKLKLPLDSLSVQSFATEEMTDREHGTVKGMQYSLSDCPTSRTNDQMCVCYPLPSPAEVCF